MMTAHYRMLFGLADDEIGYIIPKVEWDEKGPGCRTPEKRWYGEANSPGPGARPAWPPPCGQSFSGGSAPAATSIPSTC